MPWELASHDANGVINGTIAFPLGQDDWIEGQQDIIALMLPLALHDTSGTVNSTWCW